MHNLHIFYRFWSLQYKIPSVALELHNTRKYVIVRFLNYVLVAFDSVFCRLCNWFVMNLAGSLSQSTYFILTLTICWSYILNLIAGTYITNIFTSIKVPRGRSCGCSVGLSWKRTLMLMIMINRVSLELLAKCISDQQ